MVSESDKKKTRREGDGRVWDSAGQLGFIEKFSGGRGMFWKPVKRKYKGGITCCVWGCPADREEEDGIQI